MTKRRNHSATCTSPWQGGRVGPLALVIGRTMFLRIGLTRRWPRRRLGWKVWQRSLRRSIRRAHNWRPLSGLVRMKPRCIGCRMRRNSNSRRASSPCGRVRMRVGCGALNRSPWRGVRCRFHAGSFLPREHRLRRRHIQGGGTRLHCLAGRHGHFRLTALHGDLLDRLGLLLSL